MPLGAFDSLNSGDVATDTFTIQSIDGTTQTIDIAINGTNDPAVISGDFSASGDETDSALQFTGSLSSSDVDNDDNTFVAETVSGDSGDVGTLSITASGDWTFSALGAFDSLNSGDVATDTFTVQSIDGTTQTIDITINGTNDGTVFSGDFAATYIDGQGEISGVVTAEDLDDQVLLGLSGDFANGAYGSLVLNPATGEWTFGPITSAVNPLGSGDQETETFQIESGTGATETLVITIEGRDDAPTYTPTALNPSFQEGDTTSAVLFGGSNVNAIESNQTITALSLRVTGVKDGADEQLTTTANAEVATILDAEFGPQC